MANLDRPNGAVPVGTLSGGSWAGHVRMYPVDGSGSDIFPGDFVKMESDGNVNVAAAGDLHVIGVCVGYPTHQGKVTAGVFANSPKANEPDRSRGYYDASADGAGYILVCAGPDVLYEIQEDGNGAYTMVGMNVEILATAGSTSTGRSQMEFSSAGATTATAQLRVIAAVNREDNDPTLANAKWIVRLNEGHFTLIDDGGTGEGGLGV